MVDRDLRADVSIETAKDVVYRAGEITTDALEASELKDADVIIRPQVGDLHWMDFSRASDLIKIESRLPASLWKRSTILSLFIGGSLVSPNALSRGD